MKRYRILSFDFDMRIKHLLYLESICVKNSSSKTQRELEKFINGFKYEFGYKNFEQKLENLKDIGDKQFSIISYHNLFLDQIRNAFICENYYPSLTSACTLGERILNHLIIDLKDLYSKTTVDEKIKNFKTCSNWKLMIQVLKEWDVLLSNVVTNFEKLEKLRHKSIHFNKNLISDLRTYSLEAIKLIQDIIFEQFSAFGIQPWFITSIPGEIYIKKEWENNPFIIKFYIPNCFLVGPLHSLEFNPFQIKDTHNYHNTIITDEEFSNLRINK